LSHFDSLACCAVGLFNGSTTKRLSMNFFASLLTGRQISFGSN
jgi:hypothetical protein